MKNFLLMFFLLLLISLSTTVLGYPQEGQIHVDNLTIAYESFGSEAGEVVLLIPGLGAQLTMWPVELCEELTERGYRVIRFDNRDTGLSTHLDSLGRPDWQALGEAAGTGASIPLPYSLKDMADDAVELLDALNIEKAHIAGASMGGGIAQLVAIHYPDRGLSLTSFLSDTGNPDMPGPTGEALALPPAPPAGSDSDEIIKRELAVRKIIGSPGFPIDEGSLREQISRDVERSYDPDGVERQAAAVVFAGDRREGLRQLDIPTVVLHGDADILVPVENGKDTAENIPGAELRIIEGLGHDLPPELINEFAGAIAEAASRASGTNTNETQEY